MAPDPKKTQAIVEWPCPTNVATVQQFIGIASYYRRYIANFAQIAAPLNRLTQKGVTFEWNQECENAFAGLKSRLSTALILSFLQFDSNADVFSLYTDASSVGLGAVLEQNGAVIAYASRALTQGERQYSTIQKECLAIVYATKQFRHYLLGRRFRLITDHAPLQWLNAEKMEGLLRRWALSLQEYDFSIVYRKGSQNQNADTLSRFITSTECSFPTVSTVLQSSTFLTELKEAQEKDYLIQQLTEPLRTSQSTLKGCHWRRNPYCRYRQIFHQLMLINGVVCTRPHI